jgi:hypothetical protein
MGIFFFVVGGVGGDEYQRDLGTRKAVEEGSERPLIYM